MFREMVAAPFDKVCGVPATLLTVNAMVPPGGAGAPAVMAVTVEVTVTGALYTGVPVDTGTETAAWNCCPKARGAPSDRAAKTSHEEQLLVSTSTESCSGAGNILKKLPGAEVSRAGAPGGNGSLGKMVGSPL